jgi:hypothetical protein
MGDSPAVATALAHIEAWCRQDWDTTRDLLAPDVRGLVTSTTPGFGGGEFSGVDAYMERKTKAARLIEPGSLRVLSTFGDEKNALVLVTMRIGLGPSGAMVTLARSCLYLIDEHGRIKDERDSFFILSGQSS